MGEAKNVTWQEIRYLVPVIGGLITIIFFLVNMAAQLNEVQSQQNTTSSTINLMQKAQNDQGKDIAVIKEILQHNNLTDSLTPTASDIALGPLVDQSNTSATLKPTPIPTNTPQVINNSATYIVAPTTQPNPTTVPTTTIRTITTTPLPTPKPTPVPIICVGTLCI